MRAGRRTLQGSNRGAKYAISGCLEKAIAEWRRQMLAAGVKTPVPLDELGSHLRDHAQFLSPPQVKETADGSLVSELLVWFTQRDEASPSRACLRGHSVLKK